jgi:diguanylate cyclase (GGDEF)-like protein/PAS domain S-box-containing protein
MDDAVTDGSRGRQTIGGHDHPAPPEVMQAIFDRSPGCISVKDTAGRYLFVNQRFLRLAGLDLDQMVGRTDAELFAPAVAADAQARDLVVLQRDEPLETPAILTDCPDGRVYDTLKFRLVDETGRPYAICTISTDVTDQALAHDDAARSSTRAGRIMSGVLDGIVVSSADGTITDFNRAAERVFGYARDEVVGEDMAELLIPPAFREEQRAIFAAHLSGEDTRTVGGRVEAFGLRRNGEVFPLELSVIDVEVDPGRFICFFRDISDRRTAEEELRVLAEHDPLTGLPNRTTFFQALTRHLAVRGEGTEQGSLLLIDLDYFKHINDTFGHRAGDDCLRHVTRVLKERIRDADVLARLGGDEFAVLLPAANVKAATKVGAALLGLLRQRPLFVDGGPIRVTACIGVAPVAVGLAPDLLLHHADSAMYEAKGAGRDRVAVYSDAAPQQRQSASEVGQAQHIRNALAEARFQLYAQPIVDLRTGQVERHELLVRMADPAGTLRLPSAFLPAAERFDLVQKIDCWVVGEAVRLLQLAEEQGHPVPRLHVNLSGRSLSDRTVLSRIEAHVLTVDASRLVFEVTESAAVTHLDTAVAFTERLAALGCGLSLDDFGIGYASFFYLKHLALQSIKIDGSFVLGMLTDSLDRAVVRATVSLAEEMGYETIGEHVDSLPLLEELRGLGVDFVQGHHLGRPRPAAVALGLESELERGQSR